MGVDPVPRTETWCAYLLIPDEIEFWQAAARRLHHRLAFRRRQDGRWTSQRLWP